MKEFTQEEIKLIKEMIAVFRSDEVLEVVFATAKQIEQLKAEGLKGISKKQRK